MASERDQQDSAASFYASPAEAREAPPEEFLYLACLHEGTGVHKPDFLAVVDAENGRIVHETPMPNVGDELHHFGWNRCSSACHGPDRSHLIVPGFRSSRIHILNVADNPRAPRIEKVIEREELVRAALHRAALGDRTGLAAARGLADAIDNPLLHAELATAV